MWGFDSESSTSESSNSEYGSDVSSVYGPSAEASDGEHYVGETDYDPKMIKVLDEAERWFGKTGYDAKWNERMTSHLGVRIPYHDSGCIYSLNHKSFRTDTEIITDFLSKLSFEQLNKVDGRGSLLHIAARYNRGGLHERRRNTGRESSTRVEAPSNIIRWLLENPNFVQRFCTDSKGNTALHAAIDAKVPSHLQLKCENYDFDYNWCNDFVATLALRELLNDANYVQNTINVLNKNGVSPLCMAMDNHCSRQDYMNCALPFSSGEKFERSTWHASTLAFSDDFGDAMDLIMEKASSQLNLNSWFETRHWHGVVGIQNDIGDAPGRPNPQVHVLSKYCYLESPTLLARLLSDQFGGVSEEAKATTLCTSVLRFEGDDDDHYSQDSASWLFNPNDCHVSKEAADMLRPFFKKHASACIKAVMNQQQQLVNEFNSLPFCSLRGEETRIRRCQFIEYHWFRLRDIVSAFNTEIRTFFLSDDLIEETRDFFLCGDLLERHGLCKNIKALIFDFVGWDPIDLPSSSRKLHRLAKKESKRKRRKSSNG